MCAPFCVFLIWDLGLLFRIAEVFALSHCGFDFCQIACIVVYDYSFLLMLVSLEDMEFKILCN